MRRLIVACVSLLLGSFMLAGCSSSNDSSNNAGGSSTGATGSAMSSATSNKPAVGATGTPSDQTTVQAVQQKITSDKDLAGSKIKASLQAGSISLDGTVKTPGQKDKAEAIVRDIQTTKNQQGGVLDNLMVGS